MRSRRIGGRPWSRVAWSVAKICPDEAMLFFGSWVVFFIAPPWLLGIVIVVGPLRLYMC